MRHRLACGILAILAVWSPLTIALAADESETPPPAERRDGPPPEHRDKLRAALDANHDHVLDADEIAKASTAILTLDANGDGRVDHEEFRPQLPPIPRGEGGFRGPGRPRAGDAPPPREGAGRGEGGPSPERFTERALAFDADGDGKLDRSEMERFAGEMMQRMRRAMAERRGPPGERGRRPRDGEGPKSPESSENGERPERPRRPE